jgi:hypothetical protein
MNEAENSCSCSSIKENTNPYRCLDEKPERKRYLTELGIGRKIKLKYVLKKYYRSMWARSIWLRIGLVVGIF